MQNEIAYTTCLNRLVSTRNLHKLGINIVEHKLGLWPDRGPKHVWCSSVSVSAEHEITICGLFQM
jgi:hypothetical protein